MVDTRYALYPPYKGNRNMTWEIVIGLEVHTQLSTSSKIFSGASTAFGAEPNTQADAVSLALPGVLPVLNKGAVERAIKFGLATGSPIAPRSVFARENYFYPDLPKGYQISQFDLPVVGNGQITIQVPSTSSGRTEEKVVRITRAHLEEDAGKSLHEDFHGMTGIDLNRAGTPLLEIVSEPDMRSAAEAVAYAKALHALVQWIGICDGNMQEGSFRCDANVSVHKPGTPFGTRREPAGHRAVRPGQGRDSHDAYQGRGARLPLFPRSRFAAAGYQRGMEGAGARHAAGTAAGQTGPLCRRTRPVCL